MKLLRVVLVMAMVFGVGCSHQKRSETSSSSRHFSLSDPARAKLQSQSFTLRPGMTEAEVVACLGPPSHRFAEGPKTPDAKQGARLVLVYDVERTDVSAAYDSDKYLRIEFADSDKRLTAIRPRNLEGFQNLDHVH